MSFKNKVILITGASSGIGAATAEVFAKEGASIAIVGRNEDKLKKVSEKCKKLGAPILVIKADVSKDEELKTIVKQTIEKFKKLDVLVNNAGVFTMGSILEGTIMETFDKTINTNLRSAVFITSMAAPYLVQTKGNVINISSICGVSYIGDPTYLPYNISKAGMDHFTRGAALELLSSGVRVNTVSPGPVRTDILSNAGIERSWEQTKELLKVERITEPEEVGELILFLASDKAKSITGANYRIDVGILLKN